MLELDAEVERRLRELDERLARIEGSLGAVVSGRDATERQEREEILLNQMTSVPVALREFSRRLARIEARAEAPRT